MPTFILAHTERCGFVQGMMEKKRLKHYGALQHVRSAGDSTEVMQHHPELPVDLSWASTNKLVSQVIFSFFHCVFEVVHSCERPQSS